MLYEGFRQYEGGGADKVEDVAEHLPISVDEVVLLQAVQDDWDAAIEHLGQLRL